MKITIFRLPCHPLQMSSNTGEKGNCLLWPFGYFWILSHSCGGSWPWAGGAVEAVPCWAVRVGHWGSCTSPAVKFTWDGERWNILVELLVLAAVANVSYPLFPPSGSVLLHPHCLELAVSVAGNKCCSYCKSKVQQKGRPLSITC